jgi:molybdopterin-guanine dinucleotide biosynthesis protein A
MGRDKALLPFRGGVLAQAVAREVESAAGSAALVGSLTIPPFSTLPDAYLGEGPLGGILTALQNTTAAWNLIVACDMPDIHAGLLRDLLDCAEAWDLDALLPAGPSHRMEPLCAVYHRRSLPALQDAFSNGIRKVTDAFHGLRTAVLLVPEASPFQNVNTPAEWSDYVAG